MPITTADVACGLNPKTTADLASTQRSSGECRFNKEQARVDRSS
jgi:hypothetical protein